ncbi:MAG: hypothetical protein HFF09_02450 [Oscillospiraceae bacterium]|nr:hypothetical protein [Oscillospiraceae bacterium]
MSRPRYRWWGYIKNVARAYPGLKKVPLDALNRADRRERLAVEAALGAITSLPDGKERRGIVERVLFRRSHTLEGAALAEAVSYMTARRYQGDFIARVAEAMGLL